MDLYEIQELTNLVKKSDIQELEIERGNMRLKIVNRPTGISADFQPPVDKFSHKNTTTITPPSDEETLGTSDDADNVDGYYVLKSPIIGTFYSASSPDTKDFVAIGDSVTATTTVCIIEAMKVMNEIQADVDGTIEKIFVENGQSIEFGQPLFKIKTSR